jgi:hypothetical protein
MLLPVSRPTAPAYRQLLQGIRVSVVCPLWPDPASHLPLVLTVIFYFAGISYAHATRCPPYPVRLPLRLCELDIRPLHLPAIPHPYFSLSSLVHTP